MTRAVALRSLVALGLLAACAHAPPAPPPPPPPPVVVVAPPVASAAPSASAAAPVDDSFREQPPPPAPMKAFALPGATRERLRNGIPVLVVHQSSPFVALRVVASGGLADAGPDHAAVLDEMMFAMHGGTTSHSLFEMRSTYITLGMPEPETTWYADAVSVAFVAPVARLPQAVELAADFTLRPSFDVKNFERWRGQNASTAERQTDDAALVSERVLWCVLFGPGSCGAGTLSAARTRAVKRAEVVALHERVFDASRLSLVVAGGADDSDVISALDNTFGMITASGAPPPRPPAVPPATRLVVVDKPGTAIAAIATGFVGPAFGAPDAEAAIVAAGVLDDGSFGRLTTRLHTERHDVPWITARSSQDHDAGELGWVTRAANDRVGPALAEADQVVRTFVADGPEEEELRSVRDRNAFAFAGLFQTAPDTAREWSWVLAYGQPDEALLKRPQRYGAVTRETARSVAARYLDAERMHTVVVGDWSALRGPLTSLGWGAIQIRTPLGAVLRTEQSRRVKH